MKCLEACINFQFVCSQTLCALGYTLMSSYKRSPKYRALEPLHSQQGSGSYWARFAQPSQAHVLSSYYQFMSKIADEALAIMSLKLAESRRNWGGAKHTQLSIPTSRNMLGSSNQYHPLSSHLAKHEKCFLYGRFADIRTQRYLGERKFWPLERTLKSLNYQRI